MPLFTKRTIHPQAPQVHQPAINKNTGYNSGPKVQIHHNAPSVPKATKTETYSTPSYEYEFDLPFYYFNPFQSLFNILWIIIVILGIAAAIYIVVSTILYSIFGIILFVIPKSHKCKKCGKTFKYNRNIKRCPYCGTPIEDDIKAH